MTRSSFVLLALLAAAPTFAQAPAPAAQAPAPQAATPQPAGDAQLRLVVIDQTDAGIPIANVTLTPPVGGPITVMTDERGVVTVPALPVGVVKVSIEFSGFEPYEGTINVRRGANNQTVTMALAGFTDEVVVSDTNAQVGGDTRGSGLVTTLTPEEIDALPDDPEDLQAYLEELAGPEGATFFLNGFRGGRLPTKDEIRTIRIRQNSFSADGHESGGRAGIEIITRPSTEFAGNINFGYQGDALNARNAQALTETPEGNKQVQLFVRSPIARSKSAFSLNVNGTNRYTSNNIIAIGPNGNRIGNQVRVPTEQRNVNFGLEHALTNNSTLRLNYQRQQSESSNQGLGNFDLPERARSTESTGNLFRAQLQGVIGASSLNELRIQFNRNASATTSLTPGPALIVQDAFSSGGAGVNSNNLSNTFEIADNFDFTPRRNHQVRVGLMLEGGRYEFFDQTNPDGRTVYASLADLAIDRKLQFTQRLGVVDTSFNQYQFGFYVQDEIKINNRLSVGLGVRNEMQSHAGDALNLMPRLGFSFTANDRTTIRGGYGLYYDWFEASLYDQTLRLDGTRQREIQINYEYQADLLTDPSGNTPLLIADRAVPCTDPSQLDAGCRRLITETSGGLGPTNKTVMAADLDLPYVHQASVGVQHQLFPNVNMQLTYQRQEGRNQLRGIDINTPVLDEATGIITRPDPAFGLITEIQSTGRSVSDRMTLQTRFQLPQQRGMLQVSYQLGKNRSDFNGATSLPMDSLNPDLEWGPQGQDIRHQGQIGGMLRLPYDVRLQGNFQVRSAPAYNLTTGRDDNRNGVINDRPFGVSRNSLRGDATWNITQFTLNKSIGFGPSRTNPNTQGGGQQGGNRPQGNFQGGQGFQGGGGFRGGGRGGGNFGNASNSRFQVQLSLRAQNPLNRTIPQGWTGNMLSRYFMTATGVQNARRIEFETSFRF
jgi:hypothetical protein